MRKDILIVGQTPPPHHGQAMMTSMLFENDWGDLEVICLRMQYSESMDSVGKGSFLKLWKLIQLICRTWKVVICDRPRIIYYLPASPNLVPVVRDVVYLSLVRWMFSKTIFHFHAGGLDRYMGQNVFSKFVGKLIYGNADCSVDVNVTTPPSGQFFGAKKNVVVMNGINVEPATRNRQSVDTTQVLYLGLICDEKGAGELIEIARLLKDRSCDCVFVMVGAWVSNSYKATFELQLKNADVVEMFQFEGVKYGVDKSQILADADIFIFPTRHPTETFGLVLIEAMAFGLPIVASRWRGVGHVIGDSGCATMCDINAPCEYADGIYALVIDQGKRASMGKAAQVCYQQRFTQSIFLDEMGKVFKDVLDS